MPTTGPRSLPAACTAAASSTSTASPAASPASAERPDPIRPRSVRGSCHGVALILIVSTHSLPGERSAVERRFQRQADDEARALAGGRLDPDPPAVRLDDAVADRQAQPGPLADRLGGEER